jgi:RNA polymerase sigma-70 factor (ECF subfamily)
MPATLDELGPHRPALLGHCYRMLGSPTDAEDAVQEALLRAWRARAGFDGRASPRTWLTRIATNVCLDLLAQRRRREHPQFLCAAGEPDSALVRQPAEAWIEPIADSSILPPDADPAEQAMLRQGVRLAFVAALQYLPPRQRAMLLLVDVLGWSAAEVADSLGTSVAATNSALQRARATLATLDSHAAAGDLDAAQRRLLEGYVDAFERFDIDALTALLHHDAIVCMPPITLWLQGRAQFHAWMLGPAAECRGSRLLPVQACGTQGFGQYRPAAQGGHAAWALVVPELEGEHIARLNSFLDAERLFPLFGLPLVLPAPAPAPP